MDSTKKDLLTKIISIVSLVVLGYIFFISVYNQIIVQSGGFFYVIIFGGILILAFVLLSLVTKLIEITMEIKDNFMWNFVEILLLCHLAFLFLVFRMSYKTSVPASDTYLFRAASLLKEGELGAKGMDMFKLLIVHPSQYVYAVLLSVFLRITGDNPDSMVILNAIVLVLTAFAMDRVVRKIAGRACGVIAALCTLFIPSQSFAVYTYSSEFFFCLILLLTLDVLLVVIRETTDENKVQMLVFDIIFGSLMGLLCFTEPLMLFCIIFFVAYFIYKKKTQDENPAKPIAFIAVAFTILIILLNLVKSNALNSSLGEVMGGAMSRFALTTNPDTDEKYAIDEVFRHFHENLDNRNTNVTENFNFLTDKNGQTYTQTHSAWFSLGTQMSYMFVLVMSIACSFYMFKEKYREAFPCMAVLVGSFLVLFFRSTKENSTYYLFEVLIIVACCGLNYMYRFHHPAYSAVEENIPVDTQNSLIASAKAEAADWDAMSRARALIFVGGDNAAQTSQPVQQLQTAQSVQAVQTSQPVQNDQQIQQSVVQQQMYAEPEQEIQPSVDQEQNVQAEQAKSNEPIYTGAKISPEGYLSFFSLDEHNNAYISPQAPAAPTYEQPSYEDTAVQEEYAEAYEETPVQEEYTEVYEEVPVQEEYTGTYAEASAQDEYAETYAEASVQEEYAETYTEASAQDEYTETYGEMPSSEEYTDVYAETSEQSGYPGTYEEMPAQEEYAGTYEEAPVQEEFSEEYAEAPSVQGHAGYVQAEPAADNTYDAQVKASYGSAAHALGFSFSTDLFAGIDESVTEEPDVDAYYENTVPEHIPQVVTPYEDPVNAMFDEEEDEEDYILPSAQLSAPGDPRPYYASEDTTLNPPVQPERIDNVAEYDPEVEEFSFGESMPDLMFAEASQPEPAVQESLYAQPEPVAQETLYVQPQQAAPAPEYEQLQTAAVQEEYFGGEDTAETVTVPQEAGAATGQAPVKKKKVIKKKIIRRVVKKPVQPEPAPAPVTVQETPSSVVEEPSPVFEEPLSVSETPSFVNEAPSFINEEPAGNEGGQNDAIDLGFSMAQDMRDEMTPEDVVKNMNLEMPTDDIPELGYDEEYYDDDGFWEENTIDENNFKYIIEI